MKESRRLTAEAAETWLAANAPELRAIDNGRSVATVNEAAAALGVEPGRIAKTLAIRVGERVILVVARGDARLDNAKFKTVYGSRPRMLGAEETEALTRHPVGGVCPFGLATDLPIVCDTSIQPFSTVFPAAGSRTSSVEVEPERLRAITGAVWADLCRLTEEPS